MAGSSRAQGSFHETLIVYGRATEYCVSRARGLLYILSSIICSLRRSRAITFPMTESEGKRILLPSRFLPVSSMIRPISFSVL